MLDAQAGTSRIMPPLTTGAFGNVENEMRLSRRRSSLVKGENEAIPADQTPPFLPVAETDHGMGGPMYCFLTIWPPGEGREGYVVNIAHAIAMAATSERLAGTYNICDEPSLLELEWQGRIVQQTNWYGEVVVLPKERMPEHLLQAGNAGQHFVASSTRIRAELDTGTWYDGTKRFGARLVGSSKTRRAPLI
jgi:hypothetical protein